MSEFVITLCAGCSIVGADWSEDIDLVDAWNLTEDEAKQVISQIQAGSTPSDIEDDMFQKALEMAGFEWWLKVTE